MARRARRQRQQESAVIAQANPTPEQRARAVYVETQTVDPYGQTLVQGKIRRHAACLREPAYVTLHRRKVVSDDERRALDWYDERLAFARKGLTRDSTCALTSRGGAGDVTPSEAAINARQAIRWAKAQIQSGLLVFEQVMEQELSLSEIGGNGGAGKARARVAFKEAAGWLAKGVATRARFS